MSARNRWKISSDAPVLCAGLILAAGRSTRMGAFKPLLPLGDRTVIEWVVGTALASRLDPVMVVLGCRADEMHRVLAPYLVTIVVNPDPEGDMLSSIRCGIEALPVDRPVALTPGDQPLVRPGVVAALLSAYTASGGGIAIPVFQGRRGHPIVIAPVFFEEIRTMDGPGGLKQLTERHSGAVREVEVDTDTILLDMDTESDYEYALKRITEETHRHGI